MKIVDRETFKRMPKGTVFCKFPRFNEQTRSYGNYLFGIQEPAILEGPFDVDFYYTPIGNMDARDATSSTENDDILTDMERNLGKEYPFEHWSGRDGMYEGNDEVGFAIYSRQEVVEMIQLLQEALKDGYSENEVAI